MRRTTLLVLLVSVFALLGVRQCQPPGEFKDPRVIFHALAEKISAVEDMVRDTKRAICKLYVLTGNENMLPDFCPKRPGVCEQPIEPGPCRAYIPRFGFDSETGQCERFIYGGCGGNDNNFETLAECRRACEEPPPVCEQPIEVGPCDAVIPRWGFDPGTMICRPFNYGGCQGNDNNFETLEECEDVCPADPTPVCELPADVGPCLAVIPRWFHNAQTGQCEEFDWGGCGGNANNFETAEECQRACVRDGVCSLRPETGPCEALIERWYHDDATGRCERFIWGGCGGNANNFATLAECERTCPLCDDDMCQEHQECRLYREPRCAGPQGCVEPFCADVCDEGACPPGTECRLEEVQCVRAPCPPVRQCVPVDRCFFLQCEPWQVCETTVHTQQPFCRDTCDGFPCEPDEQCVLQPVLCVTEPCPPIATCVGFSIGN